MNQPLRVRHVSDRGIRGFDANRSRATIGHDVRAKASETALVLGAFACLTLIATFPLILHLNRALPGDLGDPLFTSWLLGWDADRLRHGLRAFWDAPIFFPSRHTIAFSEHLLGIAAPIAPVIWLTGNPILGYNVAFLLTYVIAGSGMYLLARELTGTRDAAFLAGLMFAFSPLRALHVSHLHVLAWGWMPIALWGLHRFFAHRSTLALAIFIAAFITQAFSNSYFLYYLAIASAFVVVYELSARPASRADRLRALATLAAASAVILICVGVVAWAYVSVRRQYGFRRPYGDWAVYSANVRSYFSAPMTVRLWATWLHGDEFPERQLFPGLVTLIAAAAAFWPGRGRRRAAALYGALAAAALLLSLGPEPAAWSHRLLPSGPYLWLARIVPGMDGMRVPARLGVVVLLALSALAALGLSRLLVRLQPGGRMVAVVLLGTAVVAEGWAVPLPMAPFDARGRPADRGAYRWLAQQPHGGAIELPILEWAIAPTLTYQYATLSHGHPIVNGYSGYGSSLQEFLGGAASPLNDLDRIEDALALLRAVGVRYVLVHPGDYADPGVGAETVAAIRAHPALASEEFRSEAVLAFRLREGRDEPDSPATSTGRRLLPTDFHADASDGADRLPLAFDNDGDTRWLTGRPQNGDEWIRIAFDRPRDVSAIELQTAARSFGDYPRELRVESEDGDGTTHVLYHEPMLVPYGRTLAPNVPQPALVVGLPSNRTRTLTIRQTGRTRRWFWSIHELGIFER
jgi:hypothetical protein